MSLILPPGAAQPFLLTFRRDDWHAIAFLSGHPRWEALEAMASQRPDASGSAARAILTGHDGIQVDLVNDAGLATEMAGASRRLVLCDVVASLVDERTARLDFVAPEGESVSLEVRAPSRPDARGAGLTDPGGHSVGETLPLMWREASAPAAGVCRIDAAAWPVTRAFLTLGHAMGAVRAGLKPTGEAAPGETVEFDRIGGRHAARRIRHDGLVLDFGEAERFAIGVGERPALVSGRISASADGKEITLLPESPAWAVERAVRLRLVTAGWETRIGG